jgi:hypothetical protein
MYNKPSSGTITVKYIGKPNYLKVFGKSKKKKKLKKFDLLAVYLSTKWNYVYVIAATVQFKTKI